jgi:hypothetical protein
MVDELSFKYFFVVTSLELVDNELFVGGTIIENLVLEVELVLVLLLLIDLTMLLLRAKTESLC